MKNNNIIKNNPVLVQGLGLLPVIAVTKNLKEALLMSALVLFVMIFSNAIIYLIRKLTREDINHIAIISIVATFSTVLILLAQKYLPEITVSLGIYLPLLIINSLIIFEAQNVGKSTGFGKVIINTIFSALGFSLVMIFISLIRELLGVGSLFGIKIIPDEFIIPTLQSPMLGFILVAILMLCFSKKSTNTETKEAK